MGSEMCIRDRAYSIDILEAEVGPLTGVVDPGETVTRVRTGRRDGTYTVETTSDGSLISSEIVEVACVVVPLDVELSVSCGSPRIVIELTNVSDATVAYEVDIREVEVGPLVGTIDPGETVTRVRTGRRDGTYTVRTSANGVVVSTETINVGCGTGALPQVEICLLYTSPSPRDLSTSRMPSSA